VKKKNKKMILGVVIGGVLGFSYFYFVGCKTGTCPITSNPYISIAYGSIIGLFLAMGSSNSPKKSDESLS